MLMQLAYCQKEHANDTKTLLLPLKIGVILGSSYMGFKPWKKPSEAGVVLVRQWGRTMHLPNHLIPSVTVIEQSIVVPMLAILGTMLPTSAIISGNDWFLSSMADHLTADFLASEYAKTRC